MNKSEHINRNKLIWDFLEQRINSKDFENFEMLLEADDDFRASLEKATQIHERLQNLSSSKAPYGLTEKILAQVKKDQLHFVKAPPRSRLPVLIALCLVLMMITSSIFGRSSESFHFLEVINEINITSLVSNDSSYLYVIPVSISLAVLLLVDRYLHTRFTSMQ